ncbi:hypothetical protein SDC9_142050 [bioreactor metagenome]|uniref:Uncharacterized protein n=1 Tax=bioreactor metagenome TaxID=1076179 RepID=A0A645E020_9ZZZZ
MITLYEAEGSFIIHGRRLTLVKRKVDIRLNQLSVDINVEHAAVFCSGVKGQHIVNRFAVVEIKA